MNAKCPKWLVWKWRSQPSEERAVLLSSAIPALAIRISRRGSRKDLAPATEVAMEERSSSRGWRLEVERSG